MLCLKKKFKQIINAEMNEQINGKKKQKKTKQFNKHWTQKHENYQKNM